MQTIFTWYQGRSRRAHGVIAQGQIDQILNASPAKKQAGVDRGDRRHCSLQEQKAEALRKLEATQLNLSRVRDIIAEVKKQLNVLERQARQARSYQTLHQEAKSLEIQLLANEYRVLRTTIQDVESELKMLEEQDSEQSAGLARLNAELERIKLAMTIANGTIGERHEELSKVEQQQARALTAAEIERNRAELYVQQRGQGREELERLTLEQQQGAAEAALLKRCWPRSNVSVWSESRCLRCSTGR